MERRRHKRFDVHLPVVAKIPGATYSDCLISNCSAGGLFLEFQSGQENRERAFKLPDNLDGEEITVNIPVKPNAESPIYAVAFSVVRATTSGLGVAYSDSAPPRILSPPVN